jgi:peptidoglycan/xylan/chitin deacetylase (PgdA/CDA1 family)
MSLMRGYACKVLSYHRILPAELFPEQVTQRSLLVSAESFRRQMLHVRRKYRLLTADEFVYALESGAGFPEPSCLISFDDGWRDNYLYAFPVLKEMHIPAALFVAAQHVETGTDFWPERLTRLLYALELTVNNAALLRRLLPLSSQADFLKANVSEYANLAVISLKSIPLDQIEGVLSELERSALTRRNHIRTERSICYWHELKEMLDSTLITIGSHTLSHAILTHENRRKQEEEILGSRAILEEKLQSPIFHFAYPNGDFDGPVEDMVQKAYRSAFTCLYGMNYANTSPFRIRRLHITDPSDRNENGFSTFRFSVRISGVYQRIKTIRNSLNRQSY